MKKSAALLIVIMMLLPLPVFASIADLGVSYASKYIWRGFDLNAAQPALQPYLTIYLGEGGANLSLWGSYNLGNITKNEFNELDAILSYSKQIGDSLNLALGYTYMTFPPLPGDAAKSGEINAGLTFTNVIFSPAFSLYYDHDQGKGLYAALSGKNNLNIWIVPITASLTAGYNAGQWLVNAGFSDVALSLGSSLSFGAVNIAPSINYAIIDRDLFINSGSVAEPNEFWFTITAAAGI